MRERGKVGMGRGRNYKIRQSYVCSTSANFIHKIPAYITLQRHS